MSIAEWIVTAAEVYAAAGLVFAIPFAWRAGGTPGFRALVVPGAAALWPLLLWRAAR